MTTTPSSSTQVSQSQPTVMPDCQTSASPLSALNPSASKPLTLDSRLDPNSLTATPLSETDVPSPWHYEAAVAKVEGIIHQIETGDLELAEVFDQFAIAVKQLHECEVFLQRHRQQVDILVETLTDEPGGGA